MHSNLESPSKLMRGDFYSPQISSWNPNCAGRTMSNNFQEEFFSWGVKPPHNIFPIWMYLNSKLIYKKSYIITGSSQESYLKVFLKTKWNKPWPNCPQHALFCLISVLFEVIENREPPQRGYVPDSKFTNSLCIHPSYHWRNLSKVEGWRQAGI